MTSEQIKLLKQLRAYSDSKQKHRNKRCGRYVEGISDCIETIERGDFNHIIERDMNYKVSGFVSKIKKKKQSKNGSGNTKKK